ncbi:RPE-retinal G protein-coupled receptor isoform X3 [Saccopteryx leptura]|uniref:RPE-retinal G protein-coupled receptor isoform X3 n=1 Tax=Saccopteryx leptura TaxID=249018 RepID=UPI00339D0CC4
MAESRPPPRGFGELEVLAVGTVLLVEGAGPTVRTAARSTASRASQQRWPASAAARPSPGGAITTTAPLLPPLNHLLPVHTGCGLAWNTAVSLVIFVWLSSAFWATLPLLGWGHYDYEPLGTCCTLDYSGGDRNFISFLFTMAFFNFLLPVFITLTSYRLMEQKVGKTGHLQVNTTLPARTLLLGWGPYALLYLYAAIVDVASISPKLQMVPALIAKMVPAINAVNYALGSEMVRRGIWQCLSQPRNDWDRAQ